MSSSAAKARSGHHDHAPQFPTHWAAVPYRGLGSAQEKRIERRVFRSIKYIHHLYNYIICVCMYIYTYTIQYIQSFMARASVPGIQTRFLSIKQWEVFVVSI